MVSSREGSPSGGVRATSLSLSRRASGIIEKFKGTKSRTNKSATGLTDPLEELRVSTPALDVSGDDELSVEEVGTGTVKDASGDVEMKDIVLYPGHRNARRVSVHPSVALLWDDMVRGKKLFRRFARDQEKQGKDVSSLAEGVLRANKEFQAKFNAVEQAILRQEEFTPQMVQEAYNQSSQLQMVVNTEQMRLAQEVAALKGELVDKHRKDQQRTQDHEKETLAQQEKLRLMESAFKQMEDAMRHLQSENQEYKKQTKKNQETFEKYQTEVEVKLQEFHQEISRAPSRVPSKAPSEAPPTTNTEEWLDRVNPSRQGSDKKDKKKNEKKDIILLLPLPLPDKFRIDSTRDLPSSSLPSLSSTSSDSNYLDY